MCEQASPELFAVLIHHHSSSAKTRSWFVIADEDDYDAQVAQPGSKKKTPKSAKKSVPMLRQVAKTFDDLHPSMLIVFDSCSLAWTSVHAWLCQSCCHGPDAKFGCLMITKVNQDHVGTRTAMCSIYD